jgi:cytochrome P450
VHKWLEYYISEQMASHSNGYANGKTAKSSMARSLATHTDDVEYIRGQILQSMLASKETTAVLISNAMFLLARNPGCWKRLREEVLAHPNKHELFTFDGMSSFSYLQHILKEGKFSTYRLQLVFRKTSC